MEIMDPPSGIQILWTTTQFLSFLVLVNYILFELLHQFLMIYSNTYPYIEYHNKRYVVKNLTKSGILLALVIGVIPGLWTLLRTGYWDNNLIYTVGTIYVSTDLSGLLFVPKLPTATRIHHFCVLVLGFTSIYMDYSEEGLHRAFLSLTFLSMIPYLVNTYLGMRYLEGDKIKRYILRVCLWLYAVSVLINCTLQHLYVFWIVPEFTPKYLFFKSLYLMIYYFILNDDVKLLKYLHFKYKLHLDGEEKREDKGERDDFPVKKLIIPESSEENVIALEKIEKVPRDSAVIQEALQARA